MKDTFRIVAAQVSKAVGSAYAFLLAIIIVIIWALLGPIFGYSDTWQLVINTGTTIVTFLMVFLIQNTQNRDSKALHLKLDELIRSTKGARNHMMDIEQLSDNDLEAMHTEYQALHEKYQRALENRRSKRAGML